MAFPGGLRALLCCRRGFTLLRRDYGGPADEEDGDEAVELRGPGQAPAMPVSLTQPPLRASGCSSDRSLAVAEDLCSLIPEKKCWQMQEDPDPVMKGWLQREVRGGRKAPWWRPRKYWFVLTQESLDCYSGCEVGAPRLGSLVLTSLCSVLWPDKQTYKETGYWAVTVFGRKHCSRLYTEHLAEAVHWACALQKVIVGQAPLLTPTQLSMSDLEENHSSPEILDQIYRNNPILRYTAGPIYAPLLPFPYGLGENAEVSSRGYAALRDEAVKLFHSLQELEGVRDPALLMQGVLQTCLDLPPLVDEIYCQLVKQTTDSPAPGTPANLRYWQLLTCMSCMFRPSPPVQAYLQLHLQRTETRFPGSEMAGYGHVIGEALRKTKGQERLPSLDEIAGLMGHREGAGPAPHPGSATCHGAIAAHPRVQEGLDRQPPWLVFSPLAVLPCRAGRTDSLGAFRYPGLRSMGPRCA
ncbi:pleckstrin homology domain-containing family H member 3 isoform X2 [Paroedura picta]|uniref:pleckstrin homology domain-containing family H member 3 isoform X2 n=1 Tax=Paroedura picta TaxID=143630 RepID=UPI004056B797